VPVSWSETVIDVGGVPVTTVRGGEGPPLLVLHDELGYPGWMTWNDELAARRELVIPLQPAYGRTPKVGWIRSYRDLAAFYGRLLREQWPAPLDVIGFSAGGYVAAEMAASCPHAFRRMVLVAPLGIKPEQGAIMDVLAVTVRTHVAATVARVEAPEFARIYGGDLTPEQFELFEDARAETARLGWEPFLHDPSLPYLLQGVGALPTLLVWGTDDLVVPRGCIEAYDRSVPDTTVVELPGVGHRPEIEDPAAFVAAVTGFLAD
jgi:pimeloyl-ACP methyl ester carboxylesterase